MFDQPVLTESYHGYTIDVYFDESPESPLTAFDNLWTIAALASHSRSYTSYDCKLQDLSIDDESDWDVVDRLLKSPDRRLVVPLEYNDGFRITTNYTHIAALAILDYDKILEEYGWKRLNQARRSKLTDYLQGEIDVLNAWINGDVYGYVLIDPAGDKDDSCWGYYGDSDYAIQEAKSIVDHYVNQQQAAAWTHINELALAD